MLDLTPETEALARDLAKERRLSVDLVVRDALEAQRRTLPSKGKDILPPEAIKARKACIQQIVDEIAALPDLDIRSSKEIMDDLNSI